MKNETESPSDSDLIRRCQEQDRDAQEALARRYYQKAYSMALFQVHNHDAALDISQEAFVRVFRNIRRCDPERPFAAWLYTIIRNLCGNYRQRYRQRWNVQSDLKSDSEALWGASPSPGPAESMEISERQRLIWQAIRSLPEKEKEILILREFQEMSYKEIAAALEIPLGSVMSGLYQARKKLAAALAARHITGQGDL